ncbi:MAG: hypothetical protein DCF30_22450, partial [Hyphomicrobiales bacterium]
MQTSSRRVVIATALAGLAGGCAPIGALAATSADAARRVLGRFDPTLTGIVAKPSEDLAESGVNEAYALAVAIEHMAINAGGG